MSGVTAPLRTSPSHSVRRAGKGVLAETGGGLHQHGGFSFLRVRPRGERRVLGRPCLVWQVGGGAGDGSFRFRDRWAVLWADWLSRAR